ncbi:jasmonic acid-amido synthetase JAR1 [Quillaja saponaria]|uniref:Jasmonic acid-amido synthetase JAR1 n=1 Tax=Quillaja saponaria TaxID=32244 RepID=A0AAD7QJN9_QUISA|nr:jasmonic acid-amido synthetase JAR1 [Quillaja saponaria]
MPSMEQEATRTSNRHINNDNNIDSDIISWFEKVSENAGSVQTETLRHILELNHGVEYLQKWLGNFNVQEMDSCELESLFTSLVPIISHADLESYIQRIVDGEIGPILTQQPITSLSLSSGTTEGRQKYVPFTQQTAETTRQILTLSAAYRSRVYPIRKGGRILEFLYSSKQFKTKGGLLAGSISTHYLASEEFKIKQEKTKSFTCSPVEVISGGDYKQATYCHLLLGLFFSDQVEFIASPFAYTLVQAFSAFEELWKDICHDIKEGTLNQRIELPKMRKAVLDIISPKPCLASKLETACQKLQNLDWFGLIPKLWPNAKYVCTIMTGSMQPYFKKLKHYAKGLPLVNGDYGASESWIGANLDPTSPPENVKFAVIPTFSYFEFIPIYREKEDCSSVIDDFKEDKPIPLSHVNDGQEYELVLTTFTGLYRYRLGDVVEVAGFHNGTPKLKFKGRRNLVLTVHIDKTTEHDLQLAVDRGAQLLNKAQAELVDFTSHADLEKQPGHYTIYWEIKGEVEEKVIEECCRVMDASFVDPVYVFSRKTNSIGPLELCILESGTFNKILDHFIGNGASFNQFKAPKCTNNHVILNILNSRIIRRFYSNAYA